jgi:quercetin dioxygenase-like cupin family protein
MKVLSMWKLWMVIPLALVVLGVLAAGAVAVGMQPTTTTADHHQSVQVERLALSQFPDDIQGQFRIKLSGKSRTTVVNVRDPDHVMVARLTFPPEVSLPWHTHPGPVIVVVEEGTFHVINALDCVERVYTAGQAFVDPGHGNVHIGFNPSEIYETVVYATFLEVPLHPETGNPMPTIPVDDPGC